MAKFTWIPIYQELATKLLKYKSDRKTLVQTLINIYEKLEIRYPIVTKDKPIDLDICPFTFYGLFNKQITDENRIRIVKELALFMELESEIPRDFDGIPVLNNMNAWFFSYDEERVSSDIQQLWDLFESAVLFADKHDQKLEEIFVQKYDLVNGRKGIGWKLTLGLFWIRPYTFLNLDNRNRNYLMSLDQMHLNHQLPSLKNPVDGKTYLEIVQICKSLILDNKIPAKSFVEFSEFSFHVTSNVNASELQSNASFLKWFEPILEALKALGGQGTPTDVRNQIIETLDLTDDLINETRGKNKVKKFDNEVAFARNYLVYEDYIGNNERGIWEITDAGRNVKMDLVVASQIFKKWVAINNKKKIIVEEQTIPEDAVNEVRYWLYAPGENSKCWDEFYTAGIMGIGWDFLENLNEFESKSDLQKKIQSYHGKQSTFIMSVHANWQFCKEMKVGDVIFVKKGVSQIVGRGIVASEYYYEHEREAYKHLRKVKWTHNGEWEHPGQAAIKTLTDITPYLDYVKKLNILLGITSDMDEEIEQIFEKYNDIDFQRDVFMDVTRYNILVNLILKKKNVILQGPPGVGKTYAAKRLAYSMMGEKDTERVLMVQFHQSYSYEDFILGYRPVNNGFELSEGPFYSFCKKAAEDSERAYFFIIDEINRGNLSKIFGELLMLIENDKRSEKLRLLYSNELFSVPPNVHIIGMMNTADRGLALIDYALRRRFAFFDMEPEFESEGFASMYETANSDQYKELVAVVKRLNLAIEEDDTLGAGFKIGHSFLCVKEAVNKEWIESVIQYELLPLIREYWFDEQALVKKWELDFMGIIYD